MLRELSIAVVLAASACSFSSPGGNGNDAPGLGEPNLDAMPGDAPPGGGAPDDAGDDAEGDAGADDDGAADADAGGDPGSQPLPPPSQPPAGDDGAADTGDDGADTDAADTGEPVDCDLEVEILWAEDAQVTSPMSLIPASEAVDTPDVALSSVEDEGEITFALDLPCAGDYYVWGLVWDYLPGAWANPDPDSFYVDVGGPELVWRYGCQTASVEGGLSWQPLERLVDQPCATTPVVLQAPGPGVYGFTLRNREPGFDSTVAGIAALAVSTDPDADPYAAYAPY